MYDEAARIGYKSVTASYNPGSDNFTQFYRHYDPVARNLEEAVLKTPAGIVNAENGIRPRNIQLRENGAIAVEWVLEE